MKHTYLTQFNKGKATYQQRVEFMVKWMNEKMSDYRHYSDTQKLFKRFIQDVKDAEAFCHRPLDEDGVYMAPTWYAAMLAQTVVADGAFEAEVALSEFYKHALGLDWDKMLHPEFDEHTTTQEFSIEYDKMYVYKFQMHYKGHIPPYSVWKNISSGKLWKLNGIADADYEEDYDKKIAEFIRNSDQEVYELEPYDWDAYVKGLDQRIFRRKGDLLKGFTKVKHG